MNNDIKKTDDSQLVITFRGLRKMTESQAEQLREHVVYNVDVIKEHHENTLLDDIFAPDPVTGNPNSDLFVRLKGDPTMRDFIDKYLSSPVPSVAKIDENDKDFSLNLVRSKYESVENYLKRIKDYQLEQSK